MAGTGGGKGPTNWVLLQDAMQPFTSQQEWREYEEAWAEGEGSKFAKIPVDLLYHKYDDEKTQRKWDAIRRAILLKIDFAKDLVRRLCSGELVAPGLQVPLDPSKTRVEIPAQFWAVLHPNFKTSTAKGGGTEFVHVLVATAEIAGAAAEQQRTDDAFGKGLVGRPSCMPAVESEMRGRAQRGELGNTLSEECRLLSEWARQNFPGQRTPTPKTISNSLRFVYRSLSTRNRT